MADHPQIAERLRRDPTVHTIPRPVRVDGPETFGLGYARTGDPGGIPLVMVPGGPGLASVLPYRKARLMAAARGFDVVMVEHRGVGLSRTDYGGADLPMDALTISAAADDIAAVLDDCGITRAVVWGSSYGGYLAQAFGARHGDRVAGMVLDATFTSAADQHTARDLVRAMLWHGDHPETADIADRLRTLVADGSVSAAETGSVIPVAYEFGGTELLRRLLDAVADGRTRTWNRIRDLATREITKPVPYMLEFDLVGAIWFRDLYGIEPDGEPLDPAANFSTAAEGFPAFQGDPFDLAAEQRRFSWPTAVLSGGYDLRAVRPVAEAMADRVPDAALVRLDELGHSVLDRHPFAGLVAAAAVANGRHHDLPDYAERIQASRQPPSAYAVKAIAYASLAVENTLPRPVDPGVPVLPTPRRTAVREARAMPLIQWAMGNGVLVSTGRASGCRRGPPLRDTPRSGRPRRQPTPFA
ncbi:alpha/beta hydrolase family protein [Murinocardiopsis flavida]|uniref:Alpha/beta hydrolase family protein n=1 Tax=Murinocardiopsis flavida TaxID=645275 RepID=A0A2P8DPE0_9ACTN|nr:alpha/beta fold hydrolase [Murinocardiopsis flavida]PSK99085.1 alpha/beta hydrolase family protein [Murinocardiopsis flavida]